MHVLTGLVASLAYWGGSLAHSTQLDPAELNSTGIYDVNVIFPRNETYALSPHMPIVFAFRNTGLARYIQSQHVSIEFHAARQNQTFRDVWTFSADQLAHDEPHIDFTAYDYLNAEDHWRMSWTYQWSSCSQDPLRLGQSSIAAGRVEFTTKNTTDELDIVAALQNSTCVASAGGVALTIPETVASTDNFNFTWGRCSVVDKAAAVEDDDFSCPVQIDAAKAKSISAWLDTHNCVGANNTVGCVETSAAPRLLVGGLATASAAAAVLGGMAYLSTLF